MLRKNFLSDVTQGGREKAEHGPGKLGTGARRGSKLLRCGARTPSFDLRRKRVKARKEKSCPGEGRDWALRPTAQEFTPTLVWLPLVWLPLLLLTLLWLTPLWLTPLWLTPLWLTPLWLTPLWLTPLWLTPLHRH